MAFEAPSQKGIAISLIVSISLAAGYLAGRLHVDAGAGWQPASHTISGEGLAAERKSAHQPQRDALNPPKTEIKATGKIRSTERRSGGFGRYETPAGPTPVFEPDSRYPARHIGGYSDPDILEPDAPGPVQRIGTFQDPDEYWLMDEPSEPVAIGDYIDPDTLSQGV